MGGLWIFILVALLLVPLIRSAKHAARPQNAPTFPPDNDLFGWGDASDESDELVSECKDLIQRTSVVQEQEGVRTTPIEVVSAASTDMVVERKAVGPKFDFRAAVVADVVLHARYKNEDWS